MHCPDLAFKTEVLPATSGSAGDWWCSAQSYSGNCLSQREPPEPVTALSKAAGHSGLVMGRKAWLLYGEMGQLCRVCCSRASGSVSQWRSLLLLDRTWLLPLCQSNSPHSLTGFTPSLPAPINFLHNQKLFPREPHLRQERKLDSSPGTLAPESMLVTSTVKSWQSMWIRKAFPQPQQPIDRRCLEICHMTAGSHQSSLICGVCQPCSPPIRSCPSTWASSLMANDYLKMLPSCPGCSLLGVLIL